MITSTSSEIVKSAAKLNQKKYRVKFNQFLVEGRHLIEEAYQLGLLDAVFSLEKTDYQDVKNYQVSVQVMKKLSDVVSPQGIIGICNKPKPKEISDKILLLDAIQDPGNLGTIIRSAVAFGFTTIVAENSVDFYNDKVIRSSQGAIFKISIVETSLIDFIDKYKDDYHIYGTDVLKGKKLSQISFNKQKVMLTLGNEGNGVRDEIKAKADENINIEMDNTESLNVSIAGSIIMYEIYKG